MRKFKSHFTEKEFKDQTVHGEKLLLAYYEDNVGRWGSARDYEPELKIKNIEYAGIPISGMIDRLDVFDDGVKIYDYKSGSINDLHKKTSAPSEKFPDGTGYWRQMVFYSFLIEKYPLKNWTPNEFNIHFFERSKDKSVYKKITVGVEEKEFVKKQLIDTYAAIKRQEFDGCKEEGCRWCDFVTRLNIRN
jgi:hypothetical protein